MEGFEHKASFLTSEELIANNLDLLFNKCTILECSAFRITRDMDFSIDEESIADLLTEMQIALQKKAQRKVVRLEISSLMSRNPGNGWRKCFILRRNTFSRSEEF